MTSGALSNPLAMSWLHRSGRGETCPNRPPQQFLAAEGDCVMRTRMLSTGR